MRQTKREYEGPRQNEELARKQLKEREAAALKNSKGLVTNDVFAHTNDEFKKACELAKVSPTKAQASKFRRKTGAAFEALRQQRLEQKLGGTD